MKLLKNLLFGSLLSLVILGSKVTILAQSGADGLGTINTSSTKKTSPKTKPKTTSSKKSVRQSKIQPSPAANKVSRRNETDTMTEGEMKAKLDAFFVALNNEPTARGVIINYGTKEQISRRESQMKKAISFRKFDAARIKFVSKISKTDFKSKFWPVPAGAEEPVP